MRKRPISRKLRRRMVFFVRCRKKVLSKSTEIQKTKKDEESNKHDNSPVKKAVIAYLICNGLGSRVLLVIFANRLLSLRFFL